jgi:hypothetical protein
VGLVRLWAIISNRNSVRTFGGQAAGATSHSVAVGAMVFHPIRCPDSFDFSAAVAKAAEQRASLGFPSRESRC